MSKISMPKTSMPKTSMIDNSGVIKLNNICYSYPGSDVMVLDHLSLEINKNDRIGMMAPNGSGKTTLLHTIMGLCRPESGNIFVFSKERKTENDFIPIRSKIGLLFQNSDDQLFCPTVLDDVAFGPLNLGFTREKAIAIAQKTLGRLGIKSFEHRVTHRMSGGQKRLVALAAVLAMAPDVLLLDEPTAGLDSKVKGELIDILNSLDISYFVISHEFDFLKAVTDKIYSMDNGKILTEDQIHIHHHEHIHKHGSQPHIHE